MEAANLPKTTISTFHEAFGHLIFKPRKPNVTFFKMKISVWKKVKNFWETSKPKYTQCDFHDFRICLWIKKGNLRRLMAIDLIWDSEWMNSRNDLSWPLISGNSRTNRGKRVHFFWETVYKERQELYNCATWIHHFNKAASFWKSVEISSHRPFENFEPRFGFNTQTLV